MAAAFQSKVYPNEADRQNAFLLWHNNFTSHLAESLKLVVPPRFSNTGANDGEVTIQVGAQKYVTVILEVKNELSSGEPLFQVLRYSQLAYEVSVMACSHSGSNSLQPL